MIDIRCSAFTTLALVGCSVDPGAPQLGIVEQGIAQLAVSHITWGTIGLDGDTPGIGPNVFPVGVRLFNLGDVTAGDLSAQLAFTSANANITVDPPSTVALAPLAPGAQADVYFNVRVAQIAAAWNTSRELQGTVAIIGSGTDVTFQPSTGFTGVTTFTYTISDSKGGTGTATAMVTADALPVAANDAATMNEDAGATAIDVLANDGDADNDPLTIIAVSDVVGGMVTIDQDRRGLTFRPAANFHGLATFTYRISDGNGGTASATVAVTIDPVNDAPRAERIVFFLSEDAPATPIDVLASCFDADGDPLTITAVIQPAGGTVTITGGGTGLTFQPASNNEFSESFAYTISDGNGGTGTSTVFVDIRSVPDAPTAVDDSAVVLEDSGATAIDVISGDSDPDFLDSLIITAVTQPLGGTVVTDGRRMLTFQPTPNFHGITAFTYTVSDRGGRTATARVTVTVSPVGGDAPTAVDDEFFLFEDESPVTLDVLANDFDPDGDALTITAATQPLGGTVTINEDAKGFTLQPQRNFHNTVTFTYTVSDGNGGSAGATVRLAFFAVEDPPQAVDDAATVTQDSGPTTIDVLGNDTDVDSDPLTIIAVTQPSDGFALIATSPASITFQPDARFTGTTSFTYTITERGGPCVNGGGSCAGNTSTATVTVHVTPVPPSVSGGGCQAGGDPAGGALVVLIGGLLIAMRRRGLSIPTY